MIPTIIRDMATDGIIGIIIIAFITIHGAIHPGDIMILGMQAHLVGDTIRGMVAIMVMDIRDIMVTAAITAAITVAVGVDTIIMETGEVDTIRKTVPG